MPNSNNSDRHLRIAASQLASILALSDTPFAVSPPPGTMRGIDVYRAQPLVRVVAKSIAQFAKSHGRLPNFVYPSSLTEKMMWSKFFTPIPLPSAGDKLAAASYLPPGYSDRIAVPNRVWISTKPLLPANDEIPPGTYWLKANHGSGFNLAIQYPLADDDRAKAQATASTWLTADYGTSWGEWWYIGFKRQLFLEMHLGESGSEVPDWKFWILNGRMHFSQVNLDRTTNHRLAFYGRDYEYLPVTNRWYPQAEPISKPDDYDAMIEAAEAIGQRFSFARVDFYLPASGQITLGEITLCPDNALTPFSSAEFDYDMGRRWDPRIIGPKPKPA